MRVSSEVEKNKRNGATYEALISVAEEAKDQTLADGVKLTCNLPLAYSVELQHLFVPIYIVVHCDKI